jgi:hypothetical protein
MCLLCIRGVSVVFILPESSGSCQLSVLPSAASLHVRCKHDISDNQFSCASTVTITACLQVQ